MQPSESGTGGVDFKLAGGSGPQIPTKVVSALASSVSVNSSVMVADWAVELVDIFNWSDKIIKLKED